MLFTDMALVTLLFRDEAVTYVFPKRIITVYVFRLINLPFIHLTHKIKET